MRDLNYQLKLLCSRNRDSSHSTQANRERNLTLIADQLHTLGFRHMTPHSLKPKHVDALLQHWKENKLTAGTIKNRMAHLRWWAEKVNKHHVIPKSNDALQIERRVYVTNEDKSWQLNPEILAQIRDARIQISLELQNAFGLRTEESIKFNPSLADKGNYIWLKGSWCKGGQERIVPVLNDQQRDLLNRAKAIAKRGSLIPRDLSYIAQLTKFQTEIYRVGLSNVHGLRHGYAQRRYQELTGWPSPAAGGPTSDQLSPEQKKIDFNARMKVSKELGHHREDVTAVYLGR